MNHLRRYLGDMRLIPVVLVAAGGLLVLKLSGIALNGGYTMGAGRMAQADAAASGPVRIVERVSAPANVPAAASPKASWAQEVFSFPDVTGSVGAKPDKPADAAPAPAPAAKKPMEPGPAPVRTIAADQTVVSASERALLERLQERRQELETRVKDLELREAVLKASEKKMESRAGDLKEQENRIVDATKQKEDGDAGRFKSLVSMYENMKAKEAAKIFDRLDMKVLMEVATLINPRRMSDILGQMSTEQAERLTVEFANRARAGAGDKTPAPAQLPKIEGRPTGS